MIKKIDKDEGLFMQVLASKINEIVEWANQLDGLSDRNAYDNDPLTSHDIETAGGTVGEPENSALGTCPKEV